MGILSRISYLSPLLLIVALPALPCAAQRKQLDAKLALIEGRDAASGTEYATFLLADTQSVQGAAQETSPTLRIECVSDRGKRKMDMYVDFGLSERVPFHPPFRKDANSPFPPSNPTVELVMSFRGYKPMKPLRRSWEALPGGEYRYRTPGRASHNMEDIDFFLAYMLAAPAVRVELARGGSAAEFDTSSLVPAVQQATLCRR